MSFIFFAFLSFLPPNLPFVGGHPAPRVILVIYFLYLAYKGELETVLKSFPLKYAGLFFIACMLAIGGHDKIQGLFKGAYNAILYVSDTILFMLVFYSIFFKVKDYIVFYRRFVLLMALFCIYGAYTYFVQTNPYIGLFVSAFDIRNISDEYLAGSQGRIQASSFFFHPYLYSFILYCTILFIIFLYNFKKQSAFRKYIVLAVIGLLLINLYFTDSRTTFLLLLLGVMLYFALNLAPAKFIGYLTVIPFFFLILNQVPQVSKITEKTTDIFFGGSDKSSGSNLNMREQQLLISVSYFYQNPIYGNGFYYINQNLGFTTKVDDRTSDADAYGFESFSFVLLIEQGLIGIAAWLVLFGALIRYHLRGFRRTEGPYKKLILVNLLVVIGYILSILATGTINSMPFFFGFMGISISMIQQNLVPFNDKAKIKDVQVQPAV